MIYPSLLQNPQNFLGILHEIGHELVTKNRSLKERIQSVILPFLYRQLRRRKESSRYVVAEEKAAWIQALKTLRILQKEGFNLFPLWNGTRDLRKWIQNNGLESYELILRKKET
jgi:hypothetical protein